MLDGLMPEQRSPGRSMRIVAVLPGGSVEPLVWLHGYDSRFAHPFLFRQPLRCRPAPSSSGIPRGCRRSRCFRSPPAALSLNKRSENLQDHAARDLPPKIRADHPGDIYHADGGKDDERIGRYASAGGGSAERPRVLLLMPWCDARGGAAAAAAPQMNMAAMDHRGALQGRVRNDAGAAVADATVMAINAENGAQFTATTDAQGAYAFAALPVGQVRRLDRRRPA